MNHSAEIGLLRIGQLSRRTGISDHLLRAWESRYGLLSPHRSAGGFRLYSRSDEERIHRMRELLGTGLAAAQAAEIVLAGGPAHFVPMPPVPDPTAALPRLRNDLRRALDDYRESAAQAAIDQLFAEFSLPTVLREVLLPYLHQIGDQWESSAAGVAQEHFASNIIRGRLAGLSRGWGDGNGPLVLLACPPGELHDLALMSFGVVASRSGWRVGFLGGAVPVAELALAADRFSPAVTVLAATTADRFEAVADELTAVALRRPLAIAGAGANKELATRIGAELLRRDPVTEAQRLGDRHGHRSEVLR